MKTNRILFLFLLCVVVTGFPVVACWVSPQEYRVQSVSGGEFFLRNIKSRNTVEVRSSKDLKLRWKIEIDDYNALFSIFRLSPDGKFLIHVRGNHMVRDINQVGVTVYGESGYCDHYKISELRSSLPKYEPKIRVSVDPKYVWCLDVNEPSNETLVVRLDETKYAWISIGTHQVEIHK